MSLSLTLPVLLVLENYGTKKKLNLNLGLTHLLWFFIITIYRTENFYSSSVGLERFY